MLRVELPFTPLAAADDEIEIDDDATITAPSTPVVNINTQEQKTKKRLPRCKNGTRRNKRSGVCEEHHGRDKTKNVPNVNVSIKEGVQTSPKRKRCPKGSRRARSGPHKGECVNYIDKQTFAKAANDAANADIANDVNDPVISTVFTTFLAESDIVALNAAIDETNSVPGDYDSFLNRGGQQALKTKRLYEYYMLIKPRLQSFFKDCYDNETNDVSTNRIIFDLLKNHGGNHIVNIEEYKGVFKTFQARIRAAVGGPCPEKLHISGRRAPAGKAFKTEIMLGDHRIKKTFMKQENDGSGDCLFYTLLDLIERAKPDKYAHFYGNSQNKMMQLRNEIVDYVINPDNAGVAYMHENHDYNPDVRVPLLGGDIEKTFGFMLENGIQTLGNILYEKDETLDENRYSVRMRNKGIWGTEIEISAAAKLYGINIYVVLSTGEDQVYYSIGGELNHDLTKLWYIFNYNERHYVVLWCLDGPGSCPPNSGATPDVSGSGAAAHAVTKRATSRPPAAIVAAPKSPASSAAVKAIPIENAESDVESEHTESPKSPDGLSAYEDDVALYPTLDDTEFNTKITNKKEFFDTRYERMDDLTIEEYANKMCSASDNFELAPHQLFVRNFLSSTTPYKSLLLYHGLGTGKTCSAICVAEEMREYFKRMGISKRIYVVASPTVKLNFKSQLFNKDKLVLNRNTGTWSMNTCVGNKLLKDNGLAIATIATAEISREQEEQMKETIAKNILAIIKSTYSFIGYEKLKTMIEQSIYGTNKADYKKLEQLTESQISGIKKRFDDALIIIDEVHNLRTTEDKNKSNDKMTGKLLTVVAKYSQNMRLLLLTATPMYNNPKEIIWLLNLMRINDNRSEIKYSDVFVGEAGEETIKTSTDDDPSHTRSAYSSGKEVLKNAAYGYISYVRGENPFTFPYRIYPAVHSPQHSFFSEPASAAVPHPTLEYTGTRIDTIKKFLDVYVTPIGTEQHRVYELCIKQLMGNAEPPVQSQSREAHESDSDSDSGDNDDGDNNDSDFGENEEEEGFGDADTPAAAAPAFADQPQKPGAGANGDYDEIAAKFGVESYTALQALTMSYPSRSLQQQQNPKTSVGKAGLMQVMVRSANGAMRYRYRADVEHVFAPENIGKWSNKIASVCKHAIECDGILLVYTQYIEGGAVPIALALEEHGFSRYNEEDRVNSNILDGPSAPQRNRRGCYTLITGNNDLSPTASIQSAISAATHSSNKDGHIIKVIIITKAGSEGLDFKNVRQVHILDPWYNLSLLEQIIGRAVRNCSHVDLPFEQRNVCIFIHGTRLTDELGVDVDVEAIDLSLFRYAESKAKRIGNVNNILKKHAIDCNLNSEYNIPAFKGGVGTITQVLTTRGDDNVFRSIQHDASVMPRTDACDYQDICDSACEPNIDMTDPNTGTDMDTYDIAFLTLNSERVIHRIRNLFKERFFYSEAELIGAINQIRTYPEDQIFTALNILIDDPIEFITDYYGRRGRLINIGNYYLFQPDGVSDRHIGIRERVMPLESVADYVQYDQYDHTNTKDFVPAEDEVAGVSQLDATMGNLFNVYTAVTTGNNFNGAADDVFIQHAPAIIIKLLQGPNIPQEILILAVMSHYLDVMDYKIAIDVANIAKRNTDLYKQEFLKCITSYFNRHAIRRMLGNMVAVALPSEKLRAWSEEKVVKLLKGHDGLETRIINEYVQNTDFMILKDDVWTEMADRIREEDGVGTELFKWCNDLRKKITTMSLTNNVVGCVRSESDAFVFKLIDVTVSNELKGARPTKRSELEKTIFQLFAVVGIDKQNRQSSEIIAYIEQSTLEPLAVLVEIILRAYDIMEVDAGPDPSNSNPKSAHRNRWFLRPCEIQAITKINQFYKKNKK
jgi:superfamily II DNA or RNA helicase